MKKDIHPKLNKECIVKCACGNTFTTISTLDSISVEICGSCHPFYTGQRRFVDTERRIDKFNKKMELAKEKMEAVKKNKESKKTRKAYKEGSLKDLLSKEEKKSKSK